MPDFPIIGQPHASPTVICSVSSPESLGVELGAFSQGLSATALVALNVYYIPFRLAAPMVARQMFIENGGTISGSFDVGIYSQDGSRLVNSPSGSVAHAGGNVLQIVDITDTLLLPGRYYMALVFDNGSALVMRGSFSPTAAVVGILNQTLGALPLPATATFAEPTLGTIPVLGITSKVTI